MKRSGISVAAAAALLCVAAAAAADWMDFDGEAYEEPAGSSLAVLLNPRDEIYGIGMGWGMWLINTPVFADYAPTFFNNGIEDAFYGGFGLTLRLMPHWKVAPFVGAGGAYNWSWSHRNDAPTGSQDSTEPSDRGESYWDGHVEAGLRIWRANRSGLFEVLGRYCRVSLQGGRDYWLVGISTGTGF